MSTANNNTALNESIETNCDISLPLLSNQETKANARIILNNDKSKASNMQNVQKHEYFLPPLLYSYGPNECESDIELEKTTFKETTGKTSTVVKHPEISALSVLSLLENNDEVEKEMDTSKDLEEEPEPPRPKIRIENLSSTLKGSEEITPPPTIKHCECKNYARTANGELIKCPKPTIFFNDNIRSVDFVLVWDSHSEDATTADAFYKRRIFEENLMKDGLDIEYEDPEQNGLNFIKIHAPKEVLRRYSEILKLRMPMRQELCTIPKDVRQRRFYRTTEYIRQKLPALPEIRSHTNFLTKGVKYIGSRWSKLKSFILVDTNIFPKKNQRFTAVYSRDKEYLFDVDSPCFFTPAIHSRVVQFILDRKKFSEKENEDFTFGIEKLLSDGVYVAAYPLHDGDLKTAGSMRYLLYTEWSSLRKWYKYQPLDYVKEYFGVKIALYFAWLGFYTHMLLPASIVGLACFIFSVATLYSNHPSEDICNSKNVTMCPLCDHWCDYWDLKETCTHSRITYLFDNATTVFFAIFMSFWAALFLELWKRYSAEITHRWDLTGFDIKEEHPRPQYLARLAHVKRKRLNVITNTEEPRVPFWRIKVPATILSFSVVMLLITLALATVLGVVLYRMSVSTALKVYKGVTTSSAIFFTSATAACINLCCIVIFNWIYSLIAQYLTEIELHRTQTEFDDSLTLKIYLLQFINYYASIFYIAFFKGKFIGSPKNYNRFFGYRQEECGPGGCLLELCIQLAIIMIGKQATNTVLEMLFPLFYKWLNTLKVKTGLQKDQKAVKGHQKQWVKDFKLVEWGSMSLFPEYLEMVLQYGFLTIFVAAFPLAPFFALLNNILEMRLDARKLLTFYRRPVTQRVRNIGVWYRILDSIGKLSVVTNGFIIAFTSNFIPRLVYRISFSKDQTLNGYLNHSLAYFNTTDFQDDSFPNTSVQYEVCRYPDYREPPWVSREYKRTSTFWHILAARLAFVVVFENVVAFVMIMVKWCIPDIPRELSDKIRREAYITNEIIIKQETLRAQSAPKTSDRLSTLERMGAGDMPSTPEQWDRLIAKSLSGSEFDFMVHNNSFPSGSPTTSDGVLKTPTSV
ncbi:Calcium-activated chloride channel [Popillia japonica]|uniref:Anoctamin n=1 Tax=Popillia japonica TaxID=7064 RepID=A0AAW1LTU2_POPJA